MLPRSLALAVSLSSMLASALTWVAAPGSTMRDRRIVDAVVAGDAESEQAHGYAGHDDSTGVVNDTTFRVARGWMRYAMTTFDDTDVTIACTFAGQADARHYDVLVEDSLVAQRTLGAQSAPSVVEIRVPFAITKGRTNIAVKVRGRDGTTPALRTLRIIQDHHEVVSSLHQLGVVR